MVRQAEKFDRALWDQMEMHAAWPPLTTDIRLGSFGVVENGLVTMVGHVEDFGATFNCQQGNTISCQVVAGKVSSRRAMADARVDATPAVEARGRLELEFSAEDSIFISAQVRPILITDVKQLHDYLREQSGWERRYRVVSTVYAAFDAVVIISGAQSSSVTLTGSVRALDAVAGGRGLGEVHYSSTGVLGKAFFGEAGTLGIRTFRTTMRGPKTAGFPGSVGSADRADRAERAERNVPVVEFDDQAEYADDEG